MIRLLGLRCGHHRHRMHMLSTRNVRLMVALPSILTYRNRARHIQSRHDRIHEWHWDLRNEIAAVIMRRHGNFKHSSVIMVGDIPTWSSSC